MRKLSEAIEELKYGYDKKTHSFKIPQDLGDEDFNDLLGRKKVRSKTSGELKAPIPPVKGYKPSAS